MTLQEAIEIVGGYVYEEKPCPVGLFDDACRLLIGAGKLVEDLRVGVPRHIIRLLPGETKE